MGSFDLNNDDRMGGGPSDFLARRLRHLLPPESHGKPSDSGAEKSKSSIDQGGTTHPASFEMYLHLGRLTGPELGWSREERLARARDQGLDRMFTAYCAQNAAHRLKLTPDLKRRLQDEISSLLGQPSKLIGATFTKAGLAVYARRDETATVRDSFGSDTIVSDAPDLSSEMEGRPLGHYFLFTLDPDIPRTEATLTSLLDGTSKVAEIDNFPIMDEQSLLVFLAQLDRVLDPKLIDNPILSMIQDKIAGDYPKLADGIQGAGFLVQASQDYGVWDVNIGDCWHPLRVEAHQLDYSQDTQNPELFAVGLRADPSTGIVSCPYTVHLDDQFSGVDATRKNDPSAYRPCKGLIPIAANETHQHARLADLIARKWPSLLPSKELAPDTDSIGRKARILRAWALDGEKGHEASFLALVEFGSFFSEKPGKTIGYFLPQNSSPDRPAPLRHYGSELVGEETALLRQQGIGKSPRALIGFVGQEVWTLAYVLPAKILEAECMRLVGEDPNSSILYSLLSDAVVAKLNSGRSEALQITGQNLRLSNIKGTLVSGKEGCLTDRLFFSADAGIITPSSTTEVTKVGAVEAWMQIDRSNMYVVPLPKAAQAHPPGNSERLHSVVEHLIWGDVSNIAAIYPSTSHSPNETH